MIYFRGRSWRVSQRAFIEDFDRKFQRGLQRVFMEDFIESFREDFIGIF